MGESWEFDTPEVFTAGTVGSPGDRTFLLQVRDRGTIATVKLEKQQVQALAEVLKGLVEDLPVPDALPPDRSSFEALAPSWVVASIGVGYDRQHDRVLVVIEELVVGSDPDTSAAGDDAPDDTEVATARVLLTRAQVHAFVIRAEELVAGGRPPCPVCGRPLDPGRPCICNN